MKRIHSMPFGAVPTAGGGASLRLWAPAAQQVELLLPAGGRALPMHALPGGWFELHLEHAAPGLRYKYRIDGGVEVPDPASRWNPDDAHGASALADPLAFDWPDAAWRGRPWHEAVIYELHVGCFTPAGTFLAAIERLDDLVALGVTAIELMPVADFPGRRGWGYDGVLPYAPDASYGHPDELKQLVAAAHQRGLMVLLDVVYNHFGPDGNYLHAYAPAFFNPAVHTPWGGAINFDAAHSRTVRDFFIHNALYWTGEFHFDGLRIDAVHAMHDHSAQHFADELAQALRNGPGREREVHVVLENHANDAARLLRSDAGRPLLADAQWNDDVHHALHVLATGETDGYYIDFAAAPLQQFGRALAEGFAFQGEPSPYAGGRPHGTPSAHLPPLAFVNSLQTHDQVGNRAFGDRIAQQAAAAGRGEALRALAACVLLAPAPPMLFMGEEYAAGTPFQYFCDFTGELARAVTEGRRAEFRRFARFADPALRDRIPDPNAEATFMASKLDWSERQREPHAGMLALYTELLRCRRQELLPWLAGARSGQWALAAPGTLRITWPLAEGHHWHLLAQLAGHDGPASLAALPGRAVYRSHPHSGSGLPAWSVQAAIETHEPAGPPQGRIPDGAAGR
jgi:maltooligosyltrehalose trehalohydrolase